MRGQLSRYWRVVELTVEAKIVAEFNGDVFLASICGIAALEAASKLKFPDAEMPDIKSEVARRLTLEGLPAEHRCQTPITNGSGAVRTRYEIRLRRANKSTQAAWIAHCNARMRQSDPGHDPSGSSC